MSEQLAREQLEKYVSGIKRFNDAALLRDKGPRNMSEARQEPGQLPSIQSAQSDAGQFNLEAAQPGAAQQGRYNPFEGQLITLPDGRVVPRTPENSLGGP